MTPGPHWCSVSAASKCTCTCVRGEDHDYDLLDVPKDQDD